MQCLTCGEPGSVTFWGPAGIGGVCRDPYNPNDDDEGQHIMTGSNDRRMVPPWMDEQYPRGEPVPTPNQPDQTPAEQRPEAVLGESPLLPSCQLWTRGTDHDPHGDCPGHVD